jgi:biopolymer transport protein ExbD
MIDRLLILLAALGVTAAQAIELRPFILPSQSGSSANVSQRSPTESNAYYDGFARDVTQMDAQKVAALRTEFQNRLAAARRNKRADEQAHYERMLGILDVYGKGR